MSVLRATDVSKFYGDLQVLNGVTFEIATARRFVWVTTGIRADAVWAFQ